MHVENNIEEREQKLSIREMEAPPTGIVMYLTQISIFILTLIPNSY